MNTIDKPRIDWTLRLWWTVGILLTAGFLIKGVGIDWPLGNKATASIGRGADQPSTLGQPASPSHVSFKNIETIRVGDRVMAWNPELDAVGHKRSSDVNPSTWKRLRLYCETVWDDGTVDDIHVETLQPPEWLAANSVKVGASVPLPLDLQEMGLPPSLLAKVVAIERCPPISGGPGQVVLTTVNHLNSYLFDLTICGEDGRIEVIGATGNHKFYSESRQEWIPVEQLRPNESLVTHVGGARVISSHRCPNYHRVYNLTVEHEHVYYVTYAGALVHNNCRNRADELADQLGESHGHGTTMAVATGADANGPVTLVATNELRSDGGGYLRPDVELRPNEILVDGIHGQHAEDMIFDHAEKHGILIEEIAATRPSCAKCVDRTPAGVTILDPNGEVIFR